MNERYRLADLFDVDGHRYVINVDHIAYIKDLSDYNNDCESLRNGPSIIKMVTGEEIKIPQINRPFDVIVGGIKFYGCYEDNDDDFYPL